MTSPTQHPKTKVYRVRQAIPPHLRQTARRLYGVSHELIENLGTKDAREARTKAPAASALIAKRMDALREAHKRGGTPRPLLDNDVVGLADAYYRERLLGDETIRKDGAGDSRLYEDVAAQVRASGGRRLFARDEVHTVRGMSVRDFDKAGEGLEELEQAHRAALARGDTTLIDDELGYFLEAQGFAVERSKTPYRDLAFKVLAAEVDALEAIGRRQQGEVIETPPPVVLAHRDAPAPDTQPGLPDTATGCPFEVLLKGWAADRSMDIDAKPMPRAAYDRQQTLKRLGAFLGHRDALRVTKADAVRWKSDMQAQGRTAATVRNDLSEMSAIWKWGIANGKLPEGNNPFAGIHPPKAAKRKTEKREFTAPEAIRILMAARDETGWLRWLPWVLALTGARLAEITQSTKEDVTTIDGVQVFRIHDDGPGRSLKNQGSRRVVPIHPALIEEGFIRYVAGLPVGASIFPDLPTGRQFGTKAENATKMLARWVRDLGLTDETISPAHSWRHWFIGACRRVVMPVEVRDAITGHSAKASESANYGNPMGTLVQQMHAWVSKVEPPALADNQ